MKKTTKITESIELTYADIKFIIYDHFINKKIIKLNENDLLKIESTDTSIDSNEVMFDVEIQREIVGIINTNKNGRKDKKKIYRKS